MDSHSDLVDVLLLSDYNIYERFPELVQRVDYFLYEWSEEMLTRTESLLRKKSRSVRNIETNKERLYTNNGEDEAFTHARSLNIAWRQFAVGRLQLPRYPPERINWNKDADPVFLYGQMPALRLEIPWSTHSSMTTLSRARNCSGAATGVETPPAVAMPGCSFLKPALKRTDLQTFLTSPTLSPASSPPYSPMDSPTISIRESMSTSSFGSDATLDNESSTGAAQLKPRLRFNNSVEQCMVVFKQEKEYLPTDYEEEDSADENDSSYHRYTSGGSSGNKLAPLAARRLHGGNSKPCSRSRRTLVIKLAPTHLKGDHRKLVAVSAPTASTRSPGAYREYTYSADSDDDDAADYFDTFNGRHAQRSGDSGSTAAKLSVSGTSGGVSGYVQGCVQSVAGQVRRFVSDAVSVSTFGSDRAKSQPLPSNYVSDPFASHLKHSTRSSSAPAASTQPLHSDDGTRQTVAAEHNVVRDPFSSAPPSSNPTMSADRMLFDDDEDAIIQEFEREMQKYGPSSTGATADATQPSLALPPPALFRHYDYANDNNCANVVAPGHSVWDDDEAGDYDMYDSEYQLHRDDFDDYSDARPSALGQDCRSSSAYHTGGPLFRDGLPNVAKPGGLIAGDKTIGGGSGAAQPQANRGRSDSIIDRAEDTIVNTVDAVKWCASFISNYTIF
ncbi:hypothetical protein H4S02_009615 [Coemansia sp. RSA 2611]|nr:hypothetical protein H4S02_009615 [Coemansia sp. RSA 2611]